MSANFQAKRTILTFLAQIFPKMNCQNFKKLNFGVRISKTKSEFGISTSKIPCVPIFRQTDNFYFFSSYLPKNGFSVGNSENWYRNKNQHTRDTMCANFPAKQLTLTFLTQICPKMDLEIEIQKTNVGIKISIFKIPCAPIFRQDG